MALSDAFHFVHPRVPGSSVHAFDAAALDESPGRVAPSMASGWEGSLDLDFDLSRGKTRLRHCLHRGPLRVQRPFYPDDSGACQLYLLHPPGGLVAGDRLRIDARVHEGARALLTAPGATKAYRSLGPVAELRQHFRVAAGALLQSLPQETIVFNGAKLFTETRVELEADAQFVGWEILCLGRRAAGECFSCGALTQRFEIWRDAEPLFIERLDFEGGSVTLDAAWGFRGAPVYGAFVVVSHERGLVTRAREALPALFDVTAGQSQPSPAFVSGTELEGCAVFRFLGESVDRAHASLRQIWSAVHAAIAGTAACPPRIWST